MQLPCLKYEREREEAEPFRITLWSNWQEKMVFNIQTDKLSNPHCACMPRVKKDHSTTLKESSTGLVFDRVGHAEPDDRVGPFLWTSQSVAHSSVELWHCLPHSCISNNTTDNC